MTLSDKIHYWLEKKSYVFVTVGVCFFGISLIAFVVTTSWKEAHVRFAQSTLDEDMGKTTAGRFALENYTACKGATLVSASPSDAQCITETITGAEKLKGSAFGAEVRNELSNWLDRSAKLREE